MDDGQAAGARVRKEEGDGGGVPAWDKDDTSREASDAATSATKTNSNCMKTAASTIAV